MRRENARGIAYGRRCDIDRIIGNRGGGDAMNDEMLWYFVAGDGEERRQEGPLSTQDLLGMLSSGQITQDTFVWREGMSEWTQFGTMPELAQPVAEETVPTVADVQPAETAEFTEAFEPVAPAEPAEPPETAEPEEATETAEPAAPPAVEAAEEPVKPEPQPDIVVIREMPNHTIRYLKARNVLLIATNDYHAEPLALTKLDLIDFLRAMESATQDK